MSKRKILFVDRDGTLIEEPEDEQIDSFEKLQLLPDVIPSMLSLAEKGYEFVMVTNQDGLGTEVYPQQSFDGPHRLMMDIFESQNIHFAEVLIDKHFKQDNAFTRKPNIGLVIDYLKSGELDLDNSYVIGDRDTDIQLAENMGIQGLKIYSTQQSGSSGGKDAMTWPQIVSMIINKPRTALVHRETNESNIHVEINLDDTTKVEVKTGIGFFDHMLEQLAHHGAFSLNLNCSGDLYIDDHHTIEDCALTLGSALRKALGDKRGIQRYGFILPMDEAQAQAVVDLSGRPMLRFEVDLKSERVGELNTQMISHFFHSLAQSLGAAIHLKADGENTHHIIEGLFKATGRALRTALQREGHTLPSTKGLL